ncbi:MAG: EF-P beta-lysylation protein EpmB [Pseudomarimonas sp.]
MIPAATASTQPTPINHGDWRQLMRDCVREPRALLSMLGLDELAHRMPANSAGFPLRVPLGFVARMRFGDPHDPLLRQVLPLDDELIPVAGFVHDAVGDLDRRLAPGVLHKYRGRALLITTANCAVHCRYCFRRHFPYADETASANGWHDAIAAIGADPHIEEVILSGGDPLSLSTNKLGELTTQLQRFSHVRRLRIHSRLPIVLPQRVDTALLSWLDNLPMQKVMVVHANHGNEFDTRVNDSLAALARSGVTLLNQAVLLREVNDSVDALSDLSERGFAAGVLPYYVHQLDKVSGAAHFEVPDAHARQLLEQLRDRLPGYLVPRLVREIPGHLAKQPL